MPADSDSARAALRFVAHRCEITPEGLKVTFPSGQRREATFAEIASLVVRLLPPDPPWNTQPILDVVVPADGGGAWTAVRVFTTTVVNYAAIPGGASAQRLENVRRLGAHLVAQNPAMGLDPETAAFLQDNKPAGRFANTRHFLEYDERYR
jgi:hypothetical protein